MEVPKNKLPEKIEIIIENLKNYINEPIYFFGSINRLDFIPYNSDIDASVFTNNVKNVTLQIEIFFNGMSNSENIEIKDTIVKMQNKIIRGNKIKYKNKEEGIKIELVVYDIKHKNILMEHYIKQSSNVPIIICIVLLIIKYMKMFYILPKSVYYTIKNFLFTYVVRMDSVIIVLD
jgi:hypothetical protein